MTQLRRVFWETILAVEELLDVRPRSTDVVLKSAHALAQLSTAYTKLVETADLEDRLTKLETSIAATRGR